MARLAAAVKQGGAPVLAQINHPGRQTKSKFTGHELVAPSAIPCPINREMPRALDLDEIPEWEEYYIRAAERAAEAGFDGVEIHAAHGYLVAGFLSSYTNTRVDEYGGPLENRCRFLLNIVDGIRNRDRTSKLHRLHIPRLSCQRRRHRNRISNNKCRHRNCARCTRVYFL